MKVVLCQPQIPQNAGNIVRSCAITDSDLVMIRPLGFQTDDRSLKRAGLDYWKGVRVDIYDSLEEYLVSESGVPYFFSSKAQKLYTDCSYSSDSLLIFGSETSGFPEHYKEQYSEHFYTIPMVKGARCLNLSNAAAVVLYEAWRQQGFLGAFV